MILAITGGTGFVGARLIDLAVASGVHVRALARRAQPARAGVDWITGALDDDAALARLCAGADAAIHVAGAVNAPDRAAFDRANVAGTQAMLTAAQTTGIARFVHVSSLAARRPDLSMYGASKAAAESVVMASPLDWTIVRPPAVFGPGDREMVDVYRLAARGLALLPPPGRLSLIAVDDLARLLLALARTSEPAAVLEPDDGTEGGWSHRDYARMVGAAVRRRPIAIALPRPLLMLAARADMALRGARAKLTTDRARYMAHPDWTADPARRPPPALWTPQVATANGIAQTAQWYREQGLI